MDMEEIRNFTLDQLEDELLKLKREQRTAEAQN